MAGIADLLKKSILAGVEDSSFQKAYGDTYNAKSQEQAASKQADVNKAAAVQKALLDQQTHAANTKSDQEADLAGLSKVQEMAPKDAVAATYGKAHLGADPTARNAMAAGKATDQALQHSFDGYNKGIGKLSDQVAKLDELRAAMNDPKQIAAPGVLKSLLISGVGGFNRYNNDEGGALAPPTWGQKAQDLLNNLGDNKNPLTDAQRASATALLGQAYEGAKARHATIAQGAKDSFGLNSHATPELQKRLSDTIDNSSLSQRLKALQTSAEANSARPTDQDSQVRLAPPADKPTGLMGKVAGGLSNLLNPKSTMPALAPQAGAPPPQTPPQGIGSLLQKPTAQGPMGGPAVTPQPGQNVTAPQKTVKQVLQNPTTGQKKFIYDDGTSEIK